MTNFCIEAFWNIQSTFPLELLQVQKHTLIEQFMLNKSNEMETWKDWKNISMATQLN